VKLVAGNKFRKGSYIILEANIHVWRQLVNCADFSRPSW
jgi:hypothetical protein